MTTFNRLYASYWIEAHYWIARITIVWHYHSETWLLYSSSLQNKVLLSMLYMVSSTKKVKDYACTKKLLLLTSLNVIWILIRFVSRMDFDEFSHIQIINAYLAVFVIVTNQVNFHLFIIWVFLPCYCFDCFKSKKQISVFYSSWVLLWIPFLGDGTVYSSVSDIFTVSIIKAKWLPSGSIGPIRSSRALATELWTCNISTGRGHFIVTSPLRRRH